MFGLTSLELKQFQKLNTPQKIQDFLDKLPANAEKNGETCMSPRSVLKNKKAHCIEGAMLAAVALLVHGQEPLVLSLSTTKEDEYHAVALFKQRGYWGAISKTNHNVLRFRDPIYKTVRELALSYFHEYFLTKNGKKTMLGYTRPVNLKRFGTKWITSEEPLWDMVETIYDMKHIKIVPKGSEKLIRKAHLVERKSASIKQWKKDDKRT